MEHVVDRHRFDFLRILSPLLLDNEQMGVPIQYKCKLDSLHFAQTLLHLAKIVELRLHFEDGIVAFWVPERRQSKVI